MMWTEYVSLLLTFHLFLQGNLHSIIHLGMWLCGQVRTNPVRLSTVPRNQWLSVYDPYGFLQHCDVGIMPLRVFVLFKNLVLESSTCLEVRGSFGYSFNLILFWSGPIQNYTYVLRHIFTGLVHLRRLVWVRSVHSSFFFLSLSHLFFAHLCDSVNHVPAACGPYPLLFPPLSLTSMGNLSISF